MFAKILIAIGLAFALLALLVLTFQVTLLLMFGDWYGFSLLDILQRLDVRDYLDTGVDGFDDAVDWLLDFPLPILLVAIGGLLGFIGFQMLRSEEEWNRAE